MPAMAHPMQTIGCHAPTAGYILGTLRAHSHEREFQPCEVVTRSRRKSLPAGFEDVIGSLRVCVSCLHGNASWRLLSLGGPLISGSSGWFCLAWQLSGDV